MQTKRGKGTGILSLFKSFTLNTFRDLDLHCDPEDEDDSPVKFKLATTKLVKESRMCIEADDLNDYLNSE